MHRITALDGLRGLAALTVLVHHSLLLFPALAEPHYSSEPARFGSLEWLAVHTPIHALWEGKAGVYVFFVLSGFVLTLPALTPRGYDWRRYYPRRLLRLYLPVWAAVVFAAATILLVPRSEDVSSLWLDERPRSITFMALVRDLTLVAGNGGLASPLWSLTWEILFSLALPLVIWVAFKFRPAHGVLAALSIAVTTVGGIFHESALMYPPMFLLGVILAMRQEQISRWFSRANRSVWIALLIFGVFAVSVRWLIMAFGAPGFLLGATTGIMLVGATLFVVMALEWSAARRFLQIAPLRTVGRVSFSLYLVHEPIIVAAGFALPRDPLLAAVAALVATALVTPIFYVAVEKPSIRLARAVGSIRPRVQPEPV
ncbi:acyltransferase family protein [Agromyces badenianii]|uniref:acyltransferase family protein n=1 Tax=Agromyces badenianii TaxID=2080742 RepID=UPI000D592B81|nr:acyltransferase [Agromyces badenianii]PWC05145.1 hypothetical protein DCE94_02225 [Agromyces badenianii]